MLNHTFFKYYALTYDRECVYGKSLTECREKMARKTREKITLNHVMDKMKFWGIPQASECAWDGDGWGWDFVEPYQIELATRDSQ